MLIIDPDDEGLNALRVWICEWLTGDLCQKVLVAFRKR